MSEPQLSPVAPRSGDAQDRTILLPGAFPVAEDKNEDFMPMNVVVDRVAVTPIYDTLLRRLLRRPRHYVVTVYMRWSSTGRLPPVEFYMEWKTPE